MSEHSNVVPMRADFAGFVPGSNVAAPQAGPRPFGSAANAWIWTMQMLNDRRAGCGMRFGALGVHPCEPDDVVMLLDRLFRQGRINLRQAYILRTYGERGRAPDPQFPAEVADVAPWDAAMQAMDWGLRVKGIVREGGQ